MDKIDSLELYLKKMYSEKGSELPFHGWKHISFVKKKAVMFVNSIGANVFLVKSAALTHDLNYFQNKSNHAKDGSEMRKRTLRKFGFDKTAILRIEKIVREADITTRSNSLSLEGQALSDADTLFKVLPITPVLYAHRYLDEQNSSIKDLSEKIVTEQSKLLESGIYFYTELAKKKYLKWAALNIDLWKNVNNSIEDPDVEELL